jgi:hypothetical protein
VIKTFPSRVRRILSPLDDISSVPLHECCERDRGYAIFGRGPVDAFCHVTSAFTLFVENGESLPPAERILPLVDVLEKRPAASRMISISASSAPVF